MVDEKQRQDQESGESSEAWQDVGKQFTAFGDSLAAAIQASWQDETTRQHLRELEAGLKSMATEVGKAIDEVPEPLGHRQKRRFESPYLRGPHFRPGS